MYSTAAILTEVGCQTHARPWGPLTWEEGLSIHKAVFRGGGEDYSVHSAHTTIIMMTSGD